MPCGFCGRSGVAACKEVYLTKGKSPQARSSCQYTYQFKYQPSLTPSKTSPCTNIPILCRIPGCTGTVGDKLTAVWKYNMAEHIKLYHPGYVSSFDDVGLAPLPQGMLEDMHISVEEETMMKIPHEKIPPMASVAEQENSVLLHAQNTLQPKILSSKRGQSSRGIKRTAAEAGGSGLQPHAELRGKNHSSFIH